MSMRSDRARRRATRRRNQRIILGVVFVLILSVAAFLVYGALNNQGETTGSGLQIEDIEVGTGNTAKVGDTLVVNYVGTLEDGTKFDSSYDRNQPAEFTLASGSLIEGWVQGVPGMKEGGKRRLTIPPELGYGDRDMGTIPPNSTLIFEIELIEVKQP